MNLDALTAHAVVVAFVDAYRRVEPPTSINYVSMDDEGVHIDGWVELDTLEREVARLLHIRER